MRVSCGVVERTCFRGRESIGIYGRRGKKTEAVRPRPQVPAGLDSVTLSPVVVVGEVVCVQSDLEMFHFVKTRYNYNAAVMLKCARAR